MKNIFSAIGRFLTSPLLMCLIVSVIVTLFAIWYGAAWSLVIALPLIYDYYIGHRLARLHSRLMERYAWWRVVYGIWCAGGLFLWVSWMGQKSIHSKVNASTNNIILSIRPTGCEA